MVAPSLSDYTGLITAYHRIRPKFVATVEASVSPLVDLTQFVAALPAAFDLDAAVGVQLDIVGEWAGLSRYITVPLTTPWFSFGVSGRGFGEGIWKGPLSPTTGRSPLDDETYRNLLRAKIAANAWDGTVETAGGILSGFFGDYGIDVFVEDRQDMHLNFVVPGATPSIIMLSIMAGRYIPVKPAGVGTRYVLASVSGAPVFGFGLNNSVIGGFGSGAWGVPPEYLLGIT